MVIRSVVSVFPKVSNYIYDTNIIIQCDEKNIIPFLKIFSAPIYSIDKGSVSDNMYSRKLFKILDVETGEKIDFFSLLENEYEQVRFKRKVKEEINELIVWISSPEDVILSHLNWLKINNGSEKHFKYALSVYEVQVFKLEALDFPYLQDWILKLELYKFFERLLMEVELP